MIWINKNKWIVVIIYIHTSFFFPHVYTNLCTDIPKTVDFVHILLNENTWLLLLLLQLMSNIIVGWDYFYYLFKKKNHFLFVVVVVILKSYRLCGYLFEYNVYNVEDDEILQTCCKLLLLVYGCEKCI